MELLADRLFALQLEIETRVPEIEEEIRKTDEKINNLVKAMETGPILEPVKKRIEDLTEIKKNLQLEVIKEELENPVLSREEIMFGLCKFRNLDITTQKGKQILIDGFVNSIYLYDDYFIITCNYKDGTNKVFFEDIENSDLISNGSPIIYVNRTRFAYIFLSLKCYKKSNDFSILIFKKYLATKRKVLIFVRTYSFRAIKMYFNSIFIQHDFF